MKSKIREFKAGDFTSGKMSEIFKACYLSIDLVKINHKQFGSSALISDEYAAYMVVRALGKNRKFNKYLSNEHSDVDFYGSCSTSECFDIVNEYLCNGFDSWHGVATGLLLTWGEQSNVDGEDMKRII